jgi:hypothetical protein
MESLVKLAQLNLQQYQDRPKMQGRNQIDQQTRKNFFQMERDVLLRSGLQIVKDFQPPNENFNTFVVQNKAGMGYNITVFDNDLWQVEDPMNKVNGIGTARGNKVSEMLNQIAKASPQQINIREQTTAPTGSPNPSNLSR